MATLTEARLKACKLWCYGAHGILSLIPVPRPGLGTMSCDKHWRLYFDPAALDAMSVHNAACTVLHELYHLILKHFLRVNRFLGDNPTQHQWRLANEAADLAINSMLRREGLDPPKNWLYPEQFNLPDGLSFEQYYKLLNQQQKGAQSNQPQRQNQVGKGHTGDLSQPTNGSNERSQPSGSESPSNGLPPGDEPYTGHQPQIGRGEGGSCADGQQRPWELPTPKDCNTPGIKPHEADIMVRQIADRILDKQQGSGGSGCWQRWAETILKPRADPRLALLRMVRHAVEATSGQGDYSYRRPNRRNPRPDLLLASAVQPVPRVTVIVDTSASMDKRDMGLSLGLIGKVLNTFRIRDGIKVVCGDTQAVASTRVFDPKQVKLAGGGGTHMGCLIEDAAKQKPRPQLIVVCTDGITPWCENVGIPVVVCLTSESRRERVPSWMKTLVLTE